MAKGLFTKSGLSSDGCFALQPTGISPLRGSRPALPIACDALNARTMAVREYHCAFCASSPAGCYTRFAALVFFARLSLRKYPAGITSWRARRVARRKRKVSDCPMTRRRYLAGVFVKEQKDRLRKAERGRTLHVYFSVLKDRTARMSFDCSRSRKSSSTP